MGSIFNWNNQDGWADWLEDSDIFLSNVIDTETDDNWFNSLAITFESDISVQVSVRASNTSFSQSDTEPYWTGFTRPDEIMTGSYSNNDLGIWASGRYQQMRIKITPLPSDLLDTSLESITVGMGMPPNMIGASQPAYEPGKILGQVIKFDGIKTVDKITLNLSVVSNERRDFFIGTGGHLAFQASNWQHSREEWVFSPVIHWSPSNAWLTSGTTIQNTGQTEDWATVDEAIASAPYLKYDIFFPSGGVYQLWGYGYVNGNGIYYGFDDDETDLRKLQLGSDLSGWQMTPRWTRFGTFYLEEGGLHSFTVYLSEQNTTILDQWLFTQDAAVEEELAADNYSLPQLSSKGPFNTVVRLRSLYNSEVDDLVTPQSNPVVNVCSWNSSLAINASGEFNYKIQDSNGAGLSFDSGLSVEYWQIGGSINHFAAWDYYRI